jgi:hypothetical protein
MEKTMLLRLRTRLGAAALIASAALISTSCAPLIIGAAAGAAGGAVTSSTERRHHSFGVYAGTVAANAVYFPAKVIFAAGGALTSGLTYIFTLGQTTASQSVWDSAVIGDYLVTPDMIEGRSKIHFVGEP